jgi:hypothetical protein
LYLKIRVRFAVLSPATQLGWLALTKRTTAERRRERPNKQLPKQAGTLLAPASQPHLSNNWFSTKKDPEMSDNGHNG